MATLAEQVQGERMARIALSMVAKPNDPTTGYVLARRGGIETLRLIETDDEVPGLARADMLMWRERLTARVTPGVLDQIAQAERHGLGTLIPSDKEWPAGLDDLGERAPYLLWTRGAASFLTTPLSDRATVTGSRAATSYGEHVADELATGLADEERSSSPVAPTASKVPRTRACSPRADTRSPSWPAGWTVPTLPGTASCWVASEMSGCW